MWVESGPCALIDLAAKCLNDRRSGSRESKHSVSLDGRGRSKFTAAGRRQLQTQPQLLWPYDRDMCMGFIELPEGQQVAPGDTVQTEMTFWIYPAVKPEIWSGRQWRIEEGGKLVAVGTILEVLDPVG
ncbi:hypothetical protein ACPVPU_04000 [Sphingomonas sp. CJ99]